MAILDDYFILRLEKEKNKITDSRGLLPVTLVVAAAGCC